MNGLAAVDGIGLSVTDLQGLSWIVIRTPIGVAVIDPAAPATPLAQSLMSFFGITVDVGVGAVPLDVQAAPSLAVTLPLVGLAIAAVLVYAYKKKR